MPDPAGRIAPLYPELVGEARGCRPRQALAAARWWVSYQVHDGMAYLQDRIPHDLSWKVKARLAQTTPVRFAGQNSAKEGFPCTNASSSWRSSL